MAGWWRFIAGVMVIAGVLLADARAQPVPPTPRQLTVFDGLPSNTVNRMAEDRQGYLWIATNDGLARFDGRNYRIWRAEDGLRDNQIWTVMADARNQLWIGTENAGLLRMSADRQSIDFFDRTRQPLMASNTVWSVAATDDGAVWFGTYEGGLYRLDSDEQLQRFLPEPGNPHSLPSNTVPYLVTLADGSLWVGTKRGLARWTGNGFERVEVPQLKDTVIIGLTADADGSLWVNTLAGAAVRRPDGRFESAPWPVPEGDQVLGVMLRDELGGYWLDTRSGLARGVQGRYQPVPLYSALSRGVVRPNWSGAYADREGGIWLASSNSGLWHLLPRWWQFSTLSRMEDDPASLRNGFVLGLAPAMRGGLWAVGTHGALDWLDPVSGRIEQHRLWVNGNNWLHSVAEDGQRRVWIGSLDALLRYEPASGQLQRWGRDAGKDAAMEGTLQNIVICGGRVWTLSTSGVQVRDLDGHVLHQALQGQAGLSPGQTNTDLICGPRGQPWLASSRGLQEWDDVQRVFHNVPGTPTGAVHAVRFEAGGRVWLSQVGTLTRLQWLDDSLHPEQVIGSAQGYPSIAANGVQEDAEGIVWATSLRGLLRVDPQSGRVRLYGVHDGLRSQEFRENTLTLSGGRMAAGTPAGVVVFDPAQVRPSRHSAPLVIERVEVTSGDHVVDLTHRSSIEIGDGDRDLHIVSRLLSFSDASANLYRYRLEGYDSDWVDAGATGERVFSRLPPGSYMLQVQARSADQVWSPVQQLQFRVLPPWWRSVPGLLLLIAAGLLLLSWFAWLYRRRLQRRHAYQLALHKQEVAEQASAAKTRFLANLGHEVRTPMTGVLGMSELLLASTLDARQRTFTESIRMAGEHLLLLVNEALDLARIESGRLELQAQVFELNLLLADVQQLMAPLAEQKGLVFELDNQLPPDVVATGDLLRVRQVLLNLLGNAIKFTGSGQIVLRAHGGPGQVLCFEVEDSGPGIGSEQQKRLFRRFEQADGARTAAQYGGSGLGLAISRELVQAMGGDIRVDSQLGRGTCFTVHLPLPLALQQEPFAPATPALRTVAADGMALRILLVEDDPTVAEVISALLQARGHEVVHAAHALAALRETIAGGFDAALLDLDLPGLSGFDLAKHLRGQGHAMPMLAVTARTDPDLAQQVRDAGMQGFVRKPVTGELLAEALAGLVSDEGA